MIMAKDEARPPGSARGAFFVAVGILTSKLVGLVRERLFAHYFGNSLVAAAFRAAWRIPNFVQNLFGEGVLSASFIPVYASLLGRSQDEDADETASAVFSLLAVLLSILVVLGIIAAPWLVDVITPGLELETRDLATTLIRIVFPGLALLVMSAWCLGVLNSHRRFFLSYASPVLWNAAIISAMLIYRHQPAAELSVYTMYGYVAGSALQLAVQMPRAIALMGRLRIRVSTQSEHVRQVLKSFVPVMISRGVVQLSAFIDSIIASGLHEFAFAALGYAQLLGTLPVSLFGMAVSAAELPEMSRVVGEEQEIASKLRARIEHSLRRIAFFVIPSSVAFVMLGDVVGATLFETGRFKPDDTRYLWLLLIGSSVGLLAMTMGRLYASAFWALKDTRTPLNFAIVRVALTASLGYWSSLVLPKQLGVAEELGAIGLLATAGIAAWVECMMLKRKLAERIGPAALPLKTGLLLYALAIVGGAAGIAIKVLLVSSFGVRGESTLKWAGDVLPQPALPPILSAALILGPYGLLYFGLSWLFRFPEAVLLVDRVLRFVKR
jgi:putative peptidoglycan lipid II flippase